MIKVSGKEFLIERAIQAYIKDFDRNNRRDGISTRDESIKWTAAANFARNWNVDADDMLSMWKICTKQAFIDTSHSHPTQGISLLLKRPTEVEGVRQAFRNLFQENLVNIDEKWDRILAFMDYINERISFVSPTSTIYLQTKESVLTYLNLWDPDHNYRYKPAPANNWASYIGYTDWESGQRFSLRKYYKMCDEIHDQVKNHDELLRVHRQRFENGEPDYDKELHILTFDVLYCFWGYEDAREEAIKEYHEVEKQQRIDELEDRLNKIREEIQDKTHALDYPDCIGLKVNHRKYGKGIASEISGDKISITFEDNVTKLFKYPGAFVEGYLQTEDGTFMNRMVRNDQLEQDLMALREQAEQIAEELSTAQME